VLTTGKEVAHHHRIGSDVTLTPTEPAQTSLEKGHIFNSNAPYLLATLRSWGHDPILIPAPLEDTAIGFQDCLRRASGMRSDEGDAPHLDLDLIITTGGVSAGKHDYVPGSVVALGGEVVFHKTTIRPGFPVLFGDIPSQGGAARLPIFGLPGNPIAVAACLRFLVSTFLQTGMGFGSKVGINLARLLPADFTSTSTTTTTAGCGIPKDPNVTSRTRSHKKPLMTRCFVPARYHAQRPPQSLTEHPSTATIPGLDLIPWVEPLTRSASLTKAMSEANCWVVLPEGKDVYEEGEVVEIVDMRP
jgi:molybdopterin biosynthesis enzyme